MRINHVKTKIEQLLELSKNITNSYNNLIKVGLTNVTNQRIHTRLSYLQEIWSQFSIIHTAITVSITELSSEEQVEIRNHVYFTEDIHDITRENFLESLEKFTSLLESDQSSVTESSSSKSVSLPSSGPHYVQHTRLPRIIIPQFSGAQEEWLPFKNLFVSLIIENPTLSDVEKLQYLKTNLKGSAFQLVKHTALTANNFKKTWDSLIAFYENTRLHVNTTFQSLLNLKRITKESAKELENLYSNIMQIYRTFETLERPVNSWDDFLVFICSQKFDSETAKLWESTLGSSKVPPSWIQFKEFLFARMLALQSYEKSQNVKILQPVKQTTAKVHHQRKSSDAFATNQTVCIICKGQHFISTCSQYNPKTIEQKLAIIKNHKLCFNCLGTHRVSMCRVTKRCQKCGQKHHTTIHQTKYSKTKEKENSERKGSPSETPTTSESKVLHSSSNISLGSSILLATAQVIVVSASGKTMNIRALIDQGSEVSIVTERVTQVLALPRSHSYTSLTGIGAQKAQKTKGVVSFVLKSHLHSDFEIAVKAYILPRLTSSLPSIQHKRDTWSHLKGLELADPEFFKPGFIDLILGADLYSQIIEEGIVKGEPNTPIAQSTKIGWIISGVAGHTKTNNPTQGYHVTVNNELFDIVKRFWEVEEISTFNKPLSTDEQECENHFKATHSRDADGRYVVKLPFKGSTDKLGNSKAKATRLVTNLFNKFSINPTYAKLYTDFIQEYEDLNHMQRVKDNQNEPKRVYYLPHHGVYREQSLSTKLRVVFNGSSKTTTGYSLNQLLHSGATLQSNLFNVLIWFRLFRYVFFSDIEKMYRQIRVHPDDWDVQRILWMNLSGQLIIFTLITVTYGLICAPFLALRAFEQLIIDEGANFPLAIPTMKRGRYVDDFFGGEDTIEKTCKVVDQINQLCMAGGFSLKKWVSNDPSVLKFIPEKNRISTSSVPIDNSSIVHTLGLSWHPTTDQFNFTLNLDEPRTISKRTILSTISKLFDPLGFLTPITISGKILIQELWSSGLGWDDQLPPVLLNKWADFVEKLRGVSNFTFPRWIGFNSNDLFEIHGFSDASQQAIAAVVYLRACSNNGLATVTLIASKTKVAPLKRLTIPRLELLGAVLITKLITSILFTLNKPNLPLFAWIDSQVAYTWITNHPSRWKEFVHNRVCYIQETLPQCKWKLVPGVENPADLATRGITPSQFTENSTWWNGPNWLSQPCSAWPQASTLQANENLEERDIKVCTNVTTKLTKVWDLLSRYSNFTKLLRITALCRKFITKLKHNKTSYLSRHLTVSELETERRFWIKSVQGCSFSSEFKVLYQGQSLPKSNSLSSLTPYIDSQGLLRVGGRLQHSQLPDNAKHPFILPKESVLTTLIISDAHSRTLHGGTQITLSFTRQNYWIIRGRTAVKSFILKCVRCTRFRQQRAQQLMGQLPIERVTPSRPFLHSGVDYAGPFTIKTWKGRNAKTYKGFISLFICLATSAIHLELVTDYTSEAFIATYRRFTSRRGICATLTSDCGTNFQGADKELKNLLSASSSEWKKISACLISDGTQWKFNPPSAPHFGGKWEAGVKSVKYHLKRTIGDSILTYEEMYTLLTQIEVVLNSRPLCRLSDDPEDMSVLTPGHFLIGDNLSTIPEPSLSLVQISHLSRWQLLQQKLESFWSYWSKEYLQRQLSIYKWNKVHPSIAEGAIVLLVDERYPPSKWPLGRVIKTHPGPDGHTRVVTIKTQTSEFKRPITKICPLSINAQKT